MGITIEQFRQAKSFSEAFDLLIESLRQEVNTEKDGDLNRVFTALSFKYMEAHKLYQEFGEDMIAWYDSDDSDIRRLYDACDSADYVILAI